MSDGAPVLSRGRRYGREGEEVRLGWIPCKEKRPGLALGVRRGHRGHRARPLLMLVGGRRLVVRCQRRELHQRADQIR